MKLADEGFPARTTVLLCRTGGNGEDPQNVLDPLDLPTSGRSPRSRPPLRASTLRCNTALMSTRLYATGSEPLIGSVIRTAIEHGIAHNSVFTEHRGSLKRRVQCVHCKGLTEDVTTNPVKCAHCGLTLIVRDHYSRRYAAFQGCASTQKLAGEIPETKADIPMTMRNQRLVRLKASSASPVRSNRFHFVQPTTRLCPASAGSSCDRYDAQRRRCLPQPLSLMSSPSNPSRCSVSVLRVAESRGDSVHMHENVEVGELLE